MNPLVELFKLEVAKAKLISFETKTPMTYGVSLFEMVDNFKAKRGIKYCKMTYKMTPEDFELLKEICETNKAALQEAMERVANKKKPKCFFRV